MTLEEKIRERINSGENLDSIMEEITSIANKIEQEKKVVSSRDLYIKELEDKFYEEASRENPSRNWEIASIIMALNFADKDPNASKKDIEDIYENGSKAIESLLDTAMELTSFLMDLFR